MQNRKKIIIVFIFPKEEIKELVLQEWQDETSF